MLKSRFSSASNFIYHRINRSQTSKEEAIRCPPIPSPCPLLGGKIKRPFIRSRHDPILRICSPDILEYCGRGLWTSFDAPCYTLVEH